jgi:hypothetical protein
LFADFAGILPDFKKAAGKLAENRPQDAEVLIVW